MKTNGEAVIGAIESAFRETSPPRPDQIANDPDSLDGREAITRFQGQIVSDMDDLVKFGITSAEDLYYLTPEAIQYYLSAYLRYVVSNRPYWEFSIVAGLIEFLDRNLSTTAGVNYPEFTAEQMASIWTSLVFISDNLGCYQLGPLEDEIRSRLATVVPQWDELRTRQDS